MSLYHLLVFILSLSNSLTHPLTHNITDSHSLTHLFFHSFSNSFSYSLTPSTYAPLTHSHTGRQWSSFDNFKRHFPGLKSSVIGSINELYNEIDNTTVICQRAQDYIHADECILTYGYSRIIEQFFKAAGIKRKFQLIIAESSPSMDGHKLAHALSKVSNMMLKCYFYEKIKQNKPCRILFFLLVLFAYISIYFSFLPFLFSPPQVPSISITLIPDSNIYALMARVNKVI